MTARIEPGGGANPEDPASANIDSGTFRSIMALFPTGVTVVTTRDTDGSCKGFTSNAFASVSLDPPLLLTCVALTSETLPTLRRTRRFVVNFLKTGEHAMAAHFAAKSHDKFDGLESTMVHRGVPVLRDHSVAYLACDTELEIEAGDHIILVGRVLDGESLVPESSPLLYHRRSYLPWPEERRPE
jgi:flavin-dependent trigonelline monooxygenase, reductase component